MKSTVPSDKSYSDISIQDVMDLPVACNESHNSKGTLYICDLCHKNFNNKKDLLKHQYNHKEKNTFYCAFCYKTFLSEFTFKRHNKIHEKKKSRCIQCKLCDKEFHFIKDLEEHHREKHLDQKSFGCTHCEATFSWRENLHKHMRMHSNISSIYKCDNCLKTFMDNISLRLHKCKKRESCSDSAETKKFLCKICNKSFQFDFSFQAHMNSHEGPFAFSAYQKLQDGKIVQKMIQENPHIKDDVHLNQNTSTLKNLKSTVNDKNKDDLGTIIDRNSHTPTESNAGIEEIVLEIVDVQDVNSQNQRCLHGVEILAQGPELSSMNSFSAKNATPASELRENQMELGDLNLRSPIPSDQKTPKFLHTAKRDSTISSPCIPVKTQLFAKKAALSDDDYQDHQKKRRYPLLYDYVMTEETPFECLHCFKRFRWEISLNIHLQEHRQVPASDIVQRSNKKKKDSPSHMSRIVNKHVSSDEEDENRDFSYVNQNLSCNIKKKRGRPRKNILSASFSGTGKQSVQPSKFSSPGTQKFSIDASVFQVSKDSEPGKHSIKDQKSTSPTVHIKHNVLPTIETQQKNNFFVPKHKLIRFYLLRQLKLSRKRGFFPCRFCNKPFSCKASLNMHILRHTGKGAYRCKFCSQNFPDHRTLVLHRLIEEEEDENKFQCSTCSRICSSKGHLLLHLQRHLAGVWPSCQPRIPSQN